MRVQEGLRKGLEGQGDKCCVLHKGLERSFLTVPSSPFSRLLFHIFEHQSETESRRREQLVGKKTTNSPRLHIYSLLGRRPFLPKSLT